MSNYDVALGISEATLNAWLSQLYAVPFVRSKLSLSKWGADIDVRAAPTIALSPPSEVQWDDSNTTKATGVQYSEANVQLCFPQVYIKPPFGDAKTVEVQAYGKASMRPDGTFDIQMLAIWHSGSGFGFNLQVAAAIILALPEINKYLSHIPSVDWAAHSLSNPVLDIVTNSRIVLAAAEASHGATDVAGVTWPDEGLFALLLSSRRVVDRLLAKLLANPKLENRVLVDKSGPYTNFSLTLGSVTAALGEPAQSRRPSRLDVRTSLSASVGVIWRGFGVSYNLSTSPSFLNATTGVDLVKSTAEIQLRKLDPYKIAFKPSATATIPKVLSYLTWPCAQVLGLTVSTLVTRIVGWIQPAISQHIANRQYEINRLKTAVRLENLNIWETEDMTLMLEGTLVFEPGTPTSEPGTPTSTAKVQAFDRDVDAIETQVVSSLVEATSRDQETVRALLKAAAKDAPVPALRELCETMAKDVPQDEAAWKEFLGKVKQHLPDE